MLLEKFEIETINGITEDFKNEVTEKIRNLNYSNVAAINIIATAKNSVGISCLAQFAPDIVGVRIYLFFETNDAYPDEKVKFEILTIDDEEDFGDECIQDLRNKVGTKISITQENLTEILNRLSKNVLFRLSLASNELFHSNFWAWLLENFNNHAAKIFDNECNENICNICREMNHTDLSFQYDNKLIIIENKFKSYPNLDQLKRYAYNQKQNNNLNYIILVSYYEPLFLNDENIEAKDDLYEFKGKYTDKTKGKNTETDLEFQFKYLSYDSLLKNLKTFTNSMLFTNKQNQYIRDYIEMLELLIELKKYLSMEKYHEKSFGSFIEEMKNEENIKIAKSFNFDVTIQKIFGWNLIYSLLSKLETNLNMWGYCDYASRAKHVHAEVLVETPNSEYMKAMGLQLFCRKDDNISKYIWVSKENDPNIRDNIDINGKYNWFFKNTKGGSQQRTKNFRGYDFPNDAWLYRICTDLNINDKKFKDIVEIFQTELKNIENYMKK